MLDQQAAGIGCRIGNLFTGVLVMPMIFALLELTVRALRCMLKLCDDYVNGFSIMFNATKFNCVIVKPPRMCAYTEPNLHMGGNRTQIVNRW